MPARAWVNDNQNGRLAALQLGIDVSKDEITSSSQPGLRAALAVAIIADLVQIAVFPLFIEGAASPADDVLDICVGGLLSWLLGWHWEFLPSFLAKLVPGVDFVPLWTLAVTNVYRKSKQIEPKTEGTVIEGEPVKKDVGEK